MSGALRRFDQIVVHMAVGTTIDYFRVWCCDDAAQPDCLACDDQGPGTIEEYQTPK